MKWSMCLIAGLLCTEVVHASSRGLERIPEIDLTSGTYRAVLVGNNDYSDQKGIWRPLRTAQKDANSLARLLGEGYGFSDLVVLNDASRRDIILALNDLASRIEQQDSVLIYYAGHGYLDQESERGYWIPVDATGDDISTYIRNSAIRDEIAHIAKKAKHTLLISDSCFSGALLRGGSRGFTKAAGEQYYKKLAQKKSVQIFAAGGMEFVDDDYRSSGHSPFTYFLLNELKHNDNRLLSLSELSTNVTKAVANNVKQAPESGVLYGVGDELGEFIFMKTQQVSQTTNQDKNIQKSGIFPEKATSLTKKKTSEEGFLFMPRF